MRRRPWAQARAIMARGCVLWLAAGGCTRSTPAPISPTPGTAADVVGIDADTARASRIRPGITHRYYWIPQGPWAVHVLDVDRAQCWILDAAKAGDGAVGRATTSAIAEARARLSESGVIAAVNGDFFLFDPPGVPTGPHIDDGRVITGPGTRPALIIDSAGSMVLDTLRTTGWLAAETFGTEIAGWNRPLANALSVFDEGWGTATDSASGVLEVVVSSLPRGLVTAIDSLATGIAIPAGGAVLRLGAAAPAVTHLELGTLRAGVDSVSIAVAIAPRHPREALGGFPILVRDSVELPGLDAAGGARFGPVRHPRTAVGASSDGRRILLVVVDGRQAPYSDGMTLRELARLMLMLGAAEAINLDGGGSTTMVVDRGSERDPDLQVVNRPSDREGERAVANALVVTRGACVE